MPTVPQYQPQEKLAPLPGVRQSDYAPADAFGAANARATGALAGVVAQIGQQEKQKADASALLDADRKMGETEMRLFHDPQNGAFTKTGSQVFGLSDQVFPEWEKQQNAVADTLSGDQRVRFLELSQNRRQDLERQLDHHITNESDKFYADERTAYVNTSIEAAAANYTDPKRVAAEIGRAQGAVMTSLATAPPEQQKAALMEATSKIHQAVFQRTLIDDPMAARDYYEKNKDGFTVDAALQAERVLKPQILYARAQANADHILAGGVAGGAVFDALLQQESGGKQFAADGSPILSSKGAVGIAQVMPATGPEAAHLAGLKWDPARFRADPEYNKALGQAYYQRQLDVFGGDSAKALAAYNAGAGAVQRAVLVGGADWLAHMPKETRDYVPAILSRAGAQGGGKPSLSAALTAARGITDPEERQATMQEVETRVRIDEQAKRDQDNSFTESINQKIEQADPTTPINKILTPEELDYAQKSGHVDSWQARLRQRATGDTVVRQTPPDLKFSLDALLYQASMGNPAAVSEIQKITPYNPKLAYSDEDRKKIGDIQAALRTGNKATLAAAASDGEVSGTIADFTQTHLGITAEQLKKDPVAQKRAQAFDQTMRLWVSDYSAANGGKKPSYRDMVAHADALTLKIPVVEPGRFFGTNSAEKPAMEIASMNEIPEKYRQSLRDALGNNFTEAAAIDLYKRTAALGRLPK